MEVKRMPYEVGVEEARKKFPQYKFIRALTPSEQKAAFHVQDSDGKDLCLKLISPDYDLDRLDREVLALQVLSHRNVARLQEYTFRSKDGMPVRYMVEEFVEGRDLAEILVDGESWEVPRAAKFFAQVARGLDALRENSVVHRDLKPNNIRVRDSDEPVIIDFGLARHLTLPDLTNTTDGAGIGTPCYFAPEQCEGTKRDIDHRTDVFAFGVLLYQAVVGHHPFRAQGMNINDLCRRICSSEEHLSDPAFTALPKQWQVLLVKLLEKSRSKRLASAGLAADLLDSMEGAK
jgi:serine/threonine protein kinase